MKKMQFKFILIDSGVIIGPLLNHKKKHTDVI